MANPDYKDAAHPVNGSWKRNAFVEQRLYLGQNKADWGKNLIWGVAEWGNNNHEERRVKWSKKLP